MTKVEWGATIVSTVIGTAMGAWVALWWVLSNTPPAPKFRAMECYMVTEGHEPWYTSADGQILQVGNFKYLAVTREQRNSNDRYDGYKTYGFEIDIAVADRAWAKLPCPGGWK